MNQPSYISVRKHTFLSSVAMSLAAIVITVLLSCTAVALYAVHLASAKSERVITLAQSAVRGLPEFTKSLPPALSDMLNDRREPEYRNELTVSARVLPQPDPHGGVRTAIEITNNGNEVISAMSLRITLLDNREQLLCEAQEWAATPVMAEDGWRGPLMPGSTRRFVSRASCIREIDPADAVNAQVEITELRVWNDAKHEPIPAGESIAESKAPDLESAESDPNG